MQSNHQVATNSQKTSPVTPERLLAKFSYAYQTKNSLYQHFAESKPKPMVEVENYLKNFVDQQKELPADAGFQITQLMFEELMSNQKDCLNKKTKGIYLGNVITALINLKTANDLAKSIAKFGRYELYIPFTLFYTQFFYSLYLEVVTPVTLREIASFCAWEAVMEELALVTPSSIYDDFLMLKKEKHNNHPVISTEVVEWLYQLKTYFNISPTKAIFTDCNILYAVKEVSIQHMLNDPKNLNQHVFDAIVQQVKFDNNIPYNNSWRATQAIVIENNRETSDITFQRKTVTPQEILESAMTAYYKELSYQETYLSPLPTAMNNLQKYLQDYIENKQPLPDNAAFELTQIMQMSLKRCVKRTITEKEPRISEKSLLGMLGSVYLIFLLYTGLVATSKKSEIAPFIGFSGLIIFTNLLCLGFLDNDDRNNIKLHQFGEFRAWKAVMQKLNLVFIKDYEITNHTNPLKFIRDSIITNPFPDKAITKTYLPIGNKNKPEASNIAKWLGYLAINKLPLPSQKSFSSSVTLDAIQKATVLFLYENFPITLTQNNFVTIENGATADTHTALYFMLHAGVLNQESFDLLFQKKYSVLMSKKISEELWSKLPSHLRNPAIWQGILTQCQSEDAAANEEALLAYAKKLLAGNPEEILNALLNNAQSTHEKSVELSISNSSLSLLARYGDHLNENKSNITDQLLAFFHNEQPKKPKLLDIISSWINLLPKHNKHPKNHEAILGFERIFLPEFADYREPRSGLSTLQLLKLVWLALHDDENRTCSLETALDRLRDAFYEIEVEYTLDADGKKKNPNAEQKYNMDTCVSGAFNKIAEVLWGIHKDMQILYITKEGAAKKLFAIANQVQKQIDNLLNIIAINKTIEGDGADETAEASTYPDPAPFIQLTHYLQPISKNKLDTPITHIDSSYPDKNHSIRDAVFEEYRIAFKNNREHPQLLELYKKAEEYLAGVLEHAEESIPNSRIYHQFCSRQLQVSGIFAPRQEAEHRTRKEHNENVRREIALLRFKL